MKKTIDNDKGKKWKITKEISPNSHFKVSNIGRSSDRGANKLI